MARNFMENKFPHNLLISVCHGNQWQYIRAMFKHFLKQIVAEQYTRERKFCKDNLATYNTKDVLETKGNNQNRCNSSYWNRPLSTLHAKKSRMKKVEEGHSHCWAKNSFSKLDFFSASESEDSVLQQCTVFLPLTEFREAMLRFLAEHGFPSG